MDRDKELRDNRTRRVVVMGVSGAGKSWVGQRLARHLSSDFIDGDDYHAPASIQKMSAGIPLSDEDRIDWLHTLAAKIDQYRRLNLDLVVACSALKRCYRDILRTGDNSLTLLYLAGERRQLLHRLGRRDHFFRGTQMLDSQLQDLEPPDRSEAVVVECTATEEEVINQLMAVMRSSDHSYRPVDKQDSEPPL